MTLRTRTSPAVAVLLVVGVLFGVGARLQRRGVGGQAARARQVMANIQQAVGHFRLETSRVCPDDLLELVKLRLLLKRPTDPWGRPFELTCPGEHDQEGVDLASAGPDGVAGTEDDLTSWEND